MQSTHRQRTKAQKKKKKKEGKIQKQNGERLK
jgi:hypothetical protein